MHKHIKNAIVYKAEMPTEQQQAAKRAAEEPK